MLERLPSTPTPTHCSACGEVLCQCLTSSSLGEAHPACPVLKVPGHISPCMCTEADSQEDVKKMMLAESLSCVCQCWGHPAFSAHGVPLGACCTHAFSGIKNVPRLLICLKIGWHGICPLPGQPKSSSCFFPCRETWDFQKLLSVITPWPGKHGNP